MSVSKASKQELIAAYKAVLRACIDRRPSGIRQKIAQVLGTHKSFVSQITNPSDPTPLPARHLDALIEVCRLSAAEERRFLDAYGAAHEQQRRHRHAAHRRYKTLHIQVPVLDDPDRQQTLEVLIRDTVRRFSNLLVNL